MSLPVRDATRPVARPQLFCIYNRDRKWWRHSARVLITAERPARRMAECFRQYKGAGRSCSSCRETRHRSSPHRLSPSCFSLFTKSCFKLACVSLWRVTISNRRIVYSWTACSFLWPKRVYIFGRRRRHFRPRRARWFRMQSGSLICCLWAHLPRALTSLVGFWLCLQEAMNTLVESTNSKWRKPILLGEGADFAPRVLTSLEGSDDRLWRAQIWSRKLKLSGKGADFTRKVLTSLAESDDFSREERKF